MAAGANAGRLRRVACALLLGVGADASAIDLAPATELRLDRPAAAVPDFRPAQPRQLRMASSYDSYLALPASERPLIPGSTYADQYLSEDDLPAVADAEAEPVAAGQRSLATEYRGESRSRDSALVHGLSVAGTRETLGYGNLRATGTVVQQDASGELQPGAETDRSAATLFVAQDNFALTPSWRLNHSLGDQPLRAPPLLAASARVQLPSSLMRGYAAQASDGRQQWSAQLGRGGRYEGVYVQSFVPQDAGFTALDWQRRLTREWDLALHAGALGDHATIRDHQSLAAGARWRRGRAFEPRANLLVNDNGSWGLWSEADSQLGSWRHRYGLYHLEPELAWNDVNLANDRTGAHWRADFNALRHALSGGVDLEDTNVDGDPERPGHRQLSVFAGGSRQVLQRTRVGLGISATSSQPGRGAPSEATQSTGFNATVNQGFRFGTSNFQLGLTQADALDTTRLLWDHEWLPLYGTQVATTLGSEQVRARDYDDQRLIAGVSLRRDLLDQLRLSANISTDRTDRTSAGDVRTHSWTGHGTALWSFAPDWEASLLATHSQAATRGATASSTLTDDRIIVTLRWAAASGSPYRYLGVSTGAAGAGRITGVVFRDTNLDGVRNPGEEAEPGLFVYLDGRVAQQTDPQGRFEFSPVHAGRHTVAIAVEDLPLPWGLADEAPRILDVAPRGATTVDIPLIRMRDVPMGAFGQ